MRLFSLKILMRRFEKFTLNTAANPITFIEDNLVRSPIKNFLMLN
jgi:hypothetical protein